MKKVRLSESQFKSMVKMMVNEALRKVDKGHLNEGFRSGKLKKFAREHGGLSNGRWSSSFGNDIYNMTDDEFDKYIPVDREQHYARYGMNGWDKNSEFSNNNFQPLEFKDGTFMVRKDPETAYGKKSGNLYMTRSMRATNKANDGKYEYQYENPYLNSLINDTDFKPRGNWGFKGDGSLEKQNLNPRAIKQKHILSTYGDDKFKRADALANGEFKEDDDERNILNKTRRSRVNEETEYRDLWHGVEGAGFISHGEWSDPEVMYQGETINGTELENYAWSEYSLDCKDEGKEPNEEEFDNLPTSWFKRVIDNYSYGMFSDNY